MTTSTPSVTTDVEPLLAAAAAAASPWANSSGRFRAGVLDAVAGALDETVDELVELAHEESHLPTSRLRNELARTTFQLRLFADFVRADRHLGVRTDAPDPQWGSGPRPHLQAFRFAVGPVLNFAASNFPFAFSVAGGDTASALAAGCPVIVKAHPGHPKLSRATASIVRQAMTSAGAPEGTFAVLEGDEQARTALTDPRIKAAAFTGSPSGGRALFEIATSRPDPIPFYAEMGSVNPVFVTAASIAERGPEIASGLAASMTLGVGQFCTSPGVVFVPGHAADAFVADVVATIGAQGPAPMLNDRIHAAYRTRVERLRTEPGVRTCHLGAVTADGAAGTVLRVDLANALTDAAEVLHECFGPTTVIVDTPADADLIRAATAFTGELTATIHCGPDDHDVVEPLLGALMPRVGRVVFNGWPTGVAVTDAMSHGGPYPATTAPTTTSVGTAAIERFLRLVALQDVPDSYLPPALRQS